MDTNHGLEASEVPVDPPCSSAPPDSPIPATLPVVEVRELDWQAIRKVVDSQAIRARMHDVVERMETLLDRAGGPGMLFDNYRAHATDRAIQVSAMDDASPLWIIGDLHGDLLALEAALAQIRHDPPVKGASPRIIFLGDFIDDEGLALEVLLRVFELIVEAPERICVIAGNHDEALSYDGKQFASSVSPSDFADFLNANLAHEWIERAGKLALRLTAHAPRALFFPDGLLVAHGGFPLVDLHPALVETGDWNDPACLSDFVWSRAHPKARRKMPNRFSRGSQFGYEDFADFCSLSARLGRPVTHMARGHDHVDERYAIYPAYHAHPVLTTVALSRRLNRERFGPYERAPTLARMVVASLPQVYQLHPPADLIEEVFPQPKQPDEVGAATSEDVQP
jgi:Calcineurin-like phosphoesterase